MYEFDNMDAAFEVKLILLVKKHRLLYDVSEPMYNDQAKKDEAWTEIANIMSSTAYNCKVKWTRLRDNYRKARLNRQKNNIKSSDRAIKYEKELSFLSNKFIVRKNLATKLTMRKPIEVVDSDSSQHSKADCMPTPLLETTSTIHETSIPSIQANKPVHELNAFFEGIAETVKNFPKKTQIQLKRTIFNIVNDIEASLLEEQGEEDISFTNARSQEDNLNYIMTQYSDNNAAVHSEHEVLVTIKDEIDLYQNKS